MHVVAAPGSLLAAIKESGRSSTYAAPFRDGRQPTAVVVAVQREASRGSGLKLQNASSRPVTRM